ncbi:hypothetical protein RSOL_041420 [Rhizoctonia solani AG-3 Rhs1AP]|uniref:Uncharacterized protein n=1 Tax=Rhizoctonia solani AG-3 Rhs1AP TaxID=1086054 RepID=X8IW29_9AGAM|nr:hypothetical protein RSOL_041420 [Rhizoctonia solani AG-3 Rhs1AP]
MSSDFSLPSSPPSRASSPESDESFVVNDKRQPIDKNLPPIVEVNFRGWLDIWDRLDKSRNKQERDIFGLTGHFTDPDTAEQRRAKLDLSGHRPRETDTFHQISDIDSAIAIFLKKIPIRDGSIIKYHMAFNVKYTLVKDTHIPPIRLELENGDIKTVYLHKVPNTRLLEMEPKALLRIHFPFLELPCGSVVVPEDHMSQFYDMCWRPAATDVLPEELVRDWPATVNDEKYRSQKRKDKAREEDSQRQTGPLQDMARDIHANFLNPLLDRCREIIDETEELRWARHFFLGYEMRGMKNRQDSMHPPPEGSLIYKGKCSLTLWSLPA